MMSTSSACLAEEVPRRLEVTLLFSPSAWTLSGRYSHVFYYALRDATIFLSRLDPVLT